MTEEQRLALSVLLGTSGSAHIVAAGELDIETAPALAEALCESGSRARRIVLDLRAVTFLDAAAVARVWSVVRDLRGRLSVVPPTGGAALRFLQLSRLDDTLPA